MDAPMQTAPTLADRRAACPTCPDTGVVAIVSQHPLSDPTLPGHVTFEPCPDCAKGRMVVEGRRFQTRQAVARIFASYGPNDTAKARACAIRHHGEEAVAAYEAPAMQAEARFAPSIADLREAAKTTPPAMQMGG